MRALLTVTHHDRVQESYVLECSHGSTNGEAEATLGRVEGEVCLRPAGAPRRPVRLHLRRRDVYGRCVPLD
jgi:hypothetical protein